MRKIILLFIFLPFLFLELDEVISGLGKTPLYAREFKVKTIVYEGTKITVKYLGEVEVIKVKPYIKSRMRRGEKRWNFWLDVVIKNTGTKRESYHVFGEGKAEDGIWLYGGIRRPVKVDSGKERTIRIRTRYRGKTIPKEARVQVLQVFGEGDGVPTQ